MNCCYRDILDRISTPPLWFDENAVPRFEPFAPRLCANIYAKEVVLLRIRCQGCALPFEVCMSWSEADRYLGRAVSSLADAIRAKTIHYRDPPNVECCPAGPTMNSEPDRVLEFWKLATTREWARVAELEADVEPEWVREFGRDR